MGETLAVHDRPIAKQGPLAAPLTKSSQPPRHVQCVEYRRPPPPFPLREPVRVSTPLRPGEATQRVGCDVLYREHTLYPVPPDVTM